MSSKDAICALFILAAIFFELLQHHGLGDRVRRALHLLELELVAVVGVVLVLLVGIVRRGELVHDLCFGLHDINHEDTYAEGDHEVFKVDMFQHLFEPKQKLYQILSSRFQEQLDLNKLMNYTAPLL